MRQTTTRMLVNILDMAAGCQVMFTLLTFIGDNHLPRDNAILRKTPVL